MSIGPVDSIRRNRAHRLAISPGRNSRTSDQIDLVAQKISAEAKPSDLDRARGLAYGISFNRYYHGATPSITSRRC